MTYKSLFDRLPEDGIFDRGESFYLEYESRMKKYLAYNGTLGHVLNELERHSLTGIQNTSDTLNVILHAPRVIRAALEYKINHGYKGVEDFIRESIDLGLGIYRNSNATENTESIRTFRERVEGREPEPLTEPLAQQLDLTTWEYCNPALSRNSAYRLADKTGGGNVLFIALAHGGTAPGMDVYLRYLDLTQNRNSMFYTVRFSTDKCRDRTPQLTSSEIDFLREQRDGRAVTIFDEDTLTGKTLKLAETFFSGEVFPGSPIVKVVNKNLHSHGEL